MRCFFPFVLTLLIFGACKKEFQGKTNENQAPETFTVVDTIVRLGDDRLESQITLNWWGDDPDGFVKGFEFTFDSLVTPATVWHYTAANDSVFVLPIPPGQDSVDFDFYIRAVDHENLPDPTPAHLGLPVKNSPPSIAILPGPNNPTTTFPVLKFYWNAGDPDGAGSLLRVEAVWNDTTQTPFNIPSPSQSATFEATDPSANITDVNVYINNNDEPLAQTMTGLKLNDTNVLFIRAVDNSLAKSSFVASYKVYVKKVTSNLLLVDAYDNAGSTVTTFYAQNLQAIGINQFDQLSIFQTAGGEPTQQAPDNLTQARIFKLFNVIVWYGNNAAKSFSLGQKTLGQFFDNNGKLLMAMYVSGTFDEQSTFLDFTPAQALVTLPPDTVLTMNTGALVTALQTNWPDSLKSTSIVATVRPFSVTLGATALYKAELLAKKVSTGALGPWNGANTVIAKKAGNAGQTNFVFSAIELQKLNGLSNMPQLFDKIFHDEFGL